MTPSLLDCRRSRARPRVVLPEPLSPTTPTVCPSRTVHADAVHRFYVIDGAAQQTSPDFDGEPHFDIYVRASG